MRRRVCAGAWCLQTAVWGGVGSAAPADLALPWCTWAVLGEVPPLALGCPLLTEQSSSPGLPGAGSAWPLSEEVGKQKCR